MWKVAETGPQITGQSWKKTVQAESFWIFLEVEYVQILPSFLEMGKEILLYTETPHPTIPTVGITAGLTLLGILVTGALVLCMYLMCVLFLYLSEVVVMVVHAFNPSNLESKMDI